METGEWSGAEVILPWVIERSKGTNFLTLTLPFLVEVDVDMVAAGRADDELPLSSVVEYMKFGYSNEREYGSLSEPFNLI